LAALPSTTTATSTTAHPDRSAAAAAEIDQLVASYQAGVKVKDLAAQFDISRSAVCKHLNRRGIERRVRGLRPEDVSMAAELYQAGWSLARLSKKFGTSNMPVRARLLEVGVRMRDAQRQEQ
jgi:hypothetical protein